MIGRFWPRALGNLAVALLSIASLDAQDTGRSSIDEGMDAAADAARARVAEDVVARGVYERPVETRSVPLRRRSTLGTSDPLYRLGVAYYEEWTIRSGALKLRVPAYQGWGGVKPSSEFYDQQAQNGQPGEHLALAISNADFIKSTRSKYINDFGLIWVPQEYAFLSMTEVSFSEFKESLRRNIVEARSQGVEREDFLTFEDFIAFKEGNDERLGEYLPGTLVKAMEEPDLIMYFAISEFVFQTRSQELRQPMIMTMTYALVRGKLLRFDFKRLYLTDEDAPQLVAFSRRFVDDMRVLNGVSDRKIR